MQDRGTRLRLGEGLPRLSDAAKIAPHADAHHPAIRLGISATVPIAILVLLHREEDVPFALLAAVIAAFARRATNQQRIRTQTAVGIIQTVLIALGTLLASAAPSPWTLVLFTAVVAGAGTLLVDLVGWNPPGSLFFVFAFGVCASLPATTANPVAAAVTAGASSAFTVLVTVLWSLGDRSQRAVAPRHPNTTPGDRWHEDRHVHLAHAIACLIAAAGAGCTVVALGFGHPYWAIVAAIVPVVGRSTANQLLRAGHRMLGTALGVAVAALLFWYPLPLLPTLALLIVLTVGTELFVARNYSIALLFLTPMTIGMASLHGDTELEDLLSGRISETAVGVVFAIIVILLTHRVRHPLPSRAAGDLHHGRNY